MPHLFGDRQGRRVALPAAERKAAMRIQQSSHQGCAVLTLVGRLDSAAAPQVQRTILKQLAEQPPAIICDLGQVESARC
jgi:anti-anti-sigma regulatory factor